MKRKGKILISAAIAALIFVSCKPTERGYQAAYDAAKNKREKAVREKMLPSTGLLSDDGPVQRILEGDTIYVMQETLRLPSGKRLSGSWCVAVASYKMQTNANATAETLRDAGWGDAFVANGTEGRHYSVLQTMSTLDSARIVSKDFRTKTPAYPYVGLPGAPVILSY